MTSLRAVLPSRKGLAVLLVLLMAAAMSLIGSRSASAAVIWVPEGTARIDARCGAATVSFNFAPGKGAEFLLVAVTDGVPHTWGKADGMLDVGAQATLNLEAMVPQIRTAKAYSVKVTLTYTDNSAPPIVATGSASCVTTVPVPPAPKVIDDPNVKGDWHYVVPANTAEFGWTVNPDGSVTVRILTGNSTFPDGSKAKTYPALKDVFNDADGDGVGDSIDRCPGTPAGTKVGADGCPATTTYVVVHVKQSTLTPKPPTGQATRGAHFVITQVGDKAPASIQVTLSDGNVSTVKLGKISGGVAHYTLHFGAGLRVKDATASLPSGWKGQFNLSNYLYAVTPPPPPVIYKPAGDVAKRCDVKTGTTVVTVIADNSKSTRPVNFERVVIVSGKATVSGFDVPAGKKSASVLSFPSRTGKVVVRLQTEGGTVVLDTVGFDTADCAAPAPKPKPKPKPQPKPVTAKPPVVHKPPVVSPPPAKPVVHRPVTKPPAHRPVTKVDQCVNLAGHQSGPPEGTYQTLTGRRCLPLVSTKPVDTGGGEEGSAGPGGDWLLLYGGLVVGGLGGLALRRRLARR